MNTIKNKSFFQKTMMYFALFLALTSCSNDDDNKINDSANNEIVIKTSEIINSSYIGNGVQWDPYPQAYKYWNEPISTEDWNKLYERLNYMKPNLVRVVIGSYDKYASGDPNSYNQDQFIEGLEKVLQYCQDNNIAVLLGDWGYNQVDSNQFFENRLDNAARYLEYLVNTKGFSCIKYYTTVNEPNLDGSAANGNYDVWKNASLYFYDQMVALGIDDQVKLAGPDVAIFNNSDIDWVTKSVADFGDKIGIYDIHTYPPKGDMYSNNYENLLKKVKDIIPSGTEIVVGEFGFKYETGTANLDDALSTINTNNINSDPNIATDSNTLVKEYFHGVDLAALTMKIVNAGYSGGINWNLDDAMHSGTTSGMDLKVWGFWNVLGEELFGDASQENLRPHFYTYSLLSRYMQSGSKVFKVELPLKVGVDAMAVEKDGKYMIAISNMYTDDYSMILSIEGISELTGVKKFVYKEEGRKVDANGYPLPEEENKIFKSGETVNIPAETVTVITNFDY